MKLPSVCLTTGRLMLGLALSEDALGRRYTFCYATIPSARIQTFDNVHAGKGGPVLLDPAHLPLRHLRFGRVFDSFDPAADMHDSLDGSWNYVGPVMDHFGHIMAETVHRVLPSRRVFGHDVWLAVAERTTLSSEYAQLPPPYRAALEFLGVTEANLRVINRNTIVERLNIHVQATHWGSTPDPHYLDELERYTTPRLDHLHGRSGGHAKVYVARTGIEGMGNILGERYVAELLRDEGFLIFQPELHPLTVQMDTYRKAALLVFAEGAACHGTELLGRSLNNVVLLQRRPDTGGIFSRLLGVRCRSFRLCTAITFIGSAAMHPFEDRVLNEWGLSLLNVKDFLAFMRDSGVCQLRSFDAAVYATAAANDLERYLAFHVARGSRLVPAPEIERMRDIV